MPKISVIVPVYNVEKYLKSCVDSILNQTFKDFELILVDDGSPDNSPAICDKYAEKDERVFVIHQRNAGVSAARNVGIEYALKTNSEYVTFVDGDDLIDKNYLKILFDATQEKKVKISACSFVYYSDGGVVKDLREFDLKVKVGTPEELFYNGNLEVSNVWGKLYKKQCFTSIRFPLGIRFEDELTTYKVLFAEKKIACISAPLKAPLYLYRINSNGFMNNFDLNKLDNQLLATAVQMDYYFTNGYYYALTTKFIAYCKIIIDAFRTHSNIDGILSYIYSQKKVLMCFNKKYKNVLKLDNGLMFKNPWKYIKRSVKDFRIKCLLEDYANVKSQKGLIYSRLFLLKNYLKIKVY